MNALTINQAVKTYANGFTALKGVSFDVQQGEFFALLGANGAGKTTSIGKLANHFRHCRTESTLFRQHSSHGV